MAVGAGVDGMAVGAGVAGMGVGAGANGVAAGVGASVASSSPQATIIAVASTASARSRNILADGKILIDGASQRSLWRLNSAWAGRRRSWVER